MFWQLESPFPSGRLEISVPANFWHFFKIRPLRHGTLTVLPRRRSTRSLCLVSGGHFNYENTPVFFYKLRQMPPLIVLYVIALGFIFFLVFYYYYIFGRIGLGFRKTKISSPLAHENWYFELEFYKGAFIWNLKYEKCILNFFVLKF